MTQWHSLHYILYKALVVLFPNLHVVSWKLFGVSNMTCSFLMSQTKHTHYNKPTNQQNPTIPQNTNPHQTEKTDSALSVLQSSSRLWNGGEINPNAQNIVTEAI